MITRQWLKNETVSIATTTLTIFAVDASALLFQVYEGDYSKMLLIQIATILGRSLVKALLQEIFPKVFKKVPERF